jgi:hypothetical protein
MSQLRRKFTAGQRTILDETLGTIPAIVVSSPLPKSHHRHLFIKMLLLQKYILHLRASRYKAKSSSHIREGTLADLNGLQVARFKW